MADFLSGLHELVSGHHLVQGEAPGDGESRSSFRAPCGDIGDGLGLGFIAQGIDQDGPQEGVLDDQQPEGR